MATKSFLKSVDVRDAKMGKKLVKALENAKGKRYGEVQLNRTYTDVRRSDLSKYLSK